MANNRMYLFHPPTGMKIMLGKRMVSAPYYKPPSAEDLQAFYDSVFDAGGMPGHDEFVIAYESGPKWEANPNRDEWVYNPDIGISQHKDG
jgi:hypothetical protein